MSSHVRELFAIRCDSESETLISSKMEAQAWDAISALVQFLEHETYPAMKKSMFSWKNHEAYLANARETYAWRDVIDLIKASDLAEVSLQLEREERTFLSLVKSKPIMLRMAGEITNALLHSYTNRHRITFFQCDSKDPSRPAT
jgi:hypothetical protein